MKKPVLLIIAISGVLALIVGGVMVKAQKGIREIATEYSRSTPVWLDGVADGVYNGKFGNLPVSVDVSVTVASHRIEKIVINKQSSGKGYEAQGIIDRIIQTQKTNVDVIAGATISSKCIMLAVNNALKPNGATNAASSASK